MSELHEFQGVRRRCVLFGLALPALSTFAQEPSVFKATRPIKIVVPFPAGGGADICGRVAAHAVGSRFGQPAVVENRGGAGGAVGSEAVSRAPADGHTLLLASTETHSLYPHVYSNHRFRAPEFVAVTPVAKADLVLVGRKTLAVRTLSDLAELARKQQLSFSTWGAGSSAHLNTVALSAALKVPEFLHVPYQGGSPAIQALLGDQVDFAITPVPIAKGHDRLVPIGVLSAERSKHMPEVPTLREQNVDLISEIWHGLLAPPGTQASVAESLARGFMPALADAGTQKSIMESGMEPMSMSPSAFSSYLLAQNIKWAQIARSTRIRLD